ncbi:MAG: hypothetical protein ACI37Z_06690 [Candidatus Gastranaerophilaceae bacterium]
MLFVIDNSSRAWKMASQNSYYEVRFVFKRNTEYSLSIKQCFKIKNNIM